MGARRVGALGAIAVTAFSAAVVPAQARATRRQDPPHILLQVPGETQRGVQGTFCVQVPPHGDDTTGVSRCADYIDWDPRRFTMVRPRSVIQIVVKNAVTAEGAVFVRRLNAAETVVRRFDFATPVRRWRVRLPSGRYELDVNARFEMPDGRSGDTAAALGLRVLPRPSSPPPELTGRRFRDIAAPS
jgi:hypothetical protein